MDTGTPVIEDYVTKMPFKFTGTLQKVTIVLSKSGIAAPEREKLTELTEKGVE